MLVFLRPSKRQKLVLGIAGLATCLLVAWALLPRVNRWIGVVVALMVKKREVVWEGLHVRVDSNYVLLRTSDRLRVVQFHFPEDSSRSRGDLVFWRGSAVGDSVFRSQRRQCTTTWTGCSVVEDSSATPMWACIRSAKYGTGRPQVVRCLLQEGGIAALYRCVGRSCEDFDEIVRRSFGSFRRPNGVTGRESRP